MLLLPFLQRLPDGGPLYAETEFSRLIVEPWNAASALVFVGIAIYWIWKIRDEYQNYPFISFSLPLLIIGGIGGTLYHGLRSSVVFLYLDIGPIFGLSFAAGLYLWSKVWEKWWVFLIAAPLFLLGRYYGELYFSTHTVINLSYLAAAGFLLTPIAIVLYATNWRYAAWVLGALCSFAIALYFRLIDLSAPLPMGTHWLWHVFGAFACAALLGYLYRMRPLIASPARQNPAPVGETA